MLKEDNVTLITQTEAVKPSVFKVKDFKILLMPCSKHKDESQIAGYLSIL